MGQAWRVPGIRLWRPVSPSSRLSQHIKLLVLPTPIPTIGTRGAAVLEVVHILRHRFGTFLLSSYEIVKMGTEL